MSRNEKSVARLPRCARVRKKESLQPCCTQAPSQMLLQKFSRFNLPIRVICLAYPVQCLILSVIIRDFSNQICALQLPYLILLPLPRSTFECSFPWLKFFHISVKRYQEILTGWDANCSSLTTMIIKKLMCVILLWIRDRMAMTRRRHLSWELSVKMLWWKFILTSKCRGDCNFTWRWLAK